MFDNVIVVADKGYHSTSIIMAEYVASATTMIIPDNMAAEFPDPVTVAFFSHEYTLCRREPRAF